MNISSNSQLLRTFPTNRTRQPRRTKSPLPGAPGSREPEWKPSLRGVSRAQTRAQQSRPLIDSKHFANVKPLPSGTSLFPPDPTAPPRQGAAGTGRGRELRAPSGGGAGAPPGPRGPTGAPPGPGARLSFPAPRSAAPACSPPQVRRSISSAPDGGTAAPETPDRAGSPPRTSPKPSREGGEAGHRPRGGGGGGGGRGHRALRAPAPARRGAEQPRREPRARRGTPLHTFPVPR